MPNNQLINFDNPALRIAQMAAVILRNNLSFARRANRQFKREFVDIGTTITYKKPVKHQVIDGPDMTNKWQDTDQRSDTLVINKQKTIPIEFTAKEMTLTDVEYAKEFLENDMISLANKIDSDGLDLYKDINLNSGVAGTTPANLSSLLDVGVLAEQMAIPTKRWAFIDPVARGELTNAFSGVFEETMVKEIVQDAKLGRKGGLDLFSTQNVKQHTAGDADSNYSMNLNAASGTITLAIANGTGTFLEGDIITIHTVNAVNPISKEDLGFKMPFVVTADYAGGAGTLSVLPKIEDGGPYQNVTGLPVINDSITITASHKANIMATDKAFALVTVPYRKMEGFAFQERVFFDGIAITITKGGDINTLQEKTRLDIMYGWKTTYPDLAIRYLG